MSRRAHRSERPEMTAMAAAFLAALMRLVEHDSGTIAIPTGRVDLRELARVIAALKCAGNIRREKLRRAS
jgi:hypothetical protein